MRPRIARLVLNETNKVVPYADLSDTDIVSLLAVYLRVAENQGLAAFEIPRQTLIAELERTRERLKVYQSMNGGRQL
jgi:hypothetical protein